VLRIPVEMEWTSNWNSLHSAPPFDDAHSTIPQTFEKHVKRSKMLNPSWKPAFPYEAIPYEAMMFCFTSLTYLI
jgi:hypothetical protein